MPPTPPGDSDPRDDFFAQFAFARERRREGDRLAAPDYNVLRFGSYDEAQVSDMFRDILSARGSHSQGDRFLIKFLDLLELRSHFPDLDRVTVEREVYTGYGGSQPGFLDILVSPPEFGIGIENKLDAHEQPDQLNRYWEWLEDRFRKHRGFCLVYFNGTGRRPETLRAERQSGREHFREWAYVADGESVSLWLQLCEKVCDADRARWGLSQFREYLEWRLRDASPSDGRSIMDPEIREVVEYVLADPARLDLALTIGQGYEGLRQIIWKAFLDRVAETVRADLGPEWQVSVRTKDRPGIFLTKPSWAAERYVALIQYPTERQTYFGLRYKDATTAQNDAFKVALDRALGTSRLHSEYWLWLRAPDTHGWHDWSGRRTLLDMHNPETSIDYWTDSLLRMARAVEPVCG